MQHKQNGELFCVHNAHWSVELLVIISSSVTLVCYWGKPMCQKVYSFSGVGIKSVGNEFIAVDLLCLNSGFGQVLD